MANVDLVNMTGASITAGSETVPAYSVLTNRAVTGANLILCTDAKLIAFVTTLTTEEKRLGSKIIKLGKNPGFAIT